jgi:hypothetical protein
MSKTNIIVRSSNVARVLIDGVEIGLCQNVRGSDSYGHEPASGIGDIRVQENVPTLARHNVSVGVLALRKTSLYKLGIIPENGEDVLQGNVVDIEVFDKATNEIVRKYLSCSYDSGDLEVTRNAIMGTNCQFVALDVAGQM